MVGVTFSGDVIEKAQSWATMYKRRSLVLSSGLRSMIGPGPTDSRSIVSGRIGEAVPMSRRPSQTPGSLHHAHSVKVRPLPLRAVPTSRPLTEVRVCPAPDKETSRAAPSEAKLDIASEEFAATLARPERRSALMSALNLGDRASRLLMDAILIVAFSPVIVAWWLVERRHRKNRA